MTVRRVLYGLVFAVTAYFLLRGAIWIPQSPSPALQSVAVAIWLSAALVALLAPGAAPRRPGGADPVYPRPLPFPVTSAVLGMCALTAPLSFLASGERIDNLAAAGVFGAVGMVLTIICVRRRPLFAWAGIVVLAVEAVQAMDIALVLQRGLLGSMLWVALAQLLMWFTDRAYRDTARLARLQQASSAWQAAQEARRFERRQRVQFALLVAGPVLTRVIETGGSLDDTERLRARLAEGTLRDEMRAPRLLDDEVRLAIRGVRERGGALTILDENLLDDLTEAQLQRVRSELAATLRGTDAARIIVRTSADPEVAVTVVGRRAAGSGLSEDDAVELWREIRREVRTE
ncbi:hypothetical protein [Microbacterium sp. Marseille-Q6965]|uniref:hypothetical protein n=1 Tax=Microbacterium sp. Marseille-Q6965 TaxID=2965072 RepID=UPI0021B77E7D|nr:hypothetical protein [Microbacterium sp. Marseille-Q6965]